MFYDVDATPLIYDRIHDVTTITTIPDIPFAEADGTVLRLNLYRPEIDVPVSAVIYLHGGGWRGGGRADDAEKRLKPLAAHGIGVVSADYRVAPDASFPAPIHDVKAAVRWTRAHGDEYGLLTDAIGVWGVSAGATLGSLAALTPGDAMLEGMLGEDVEQSSALQAVAHWFGPADFVTTATRSPLESRIVPPPLGEALLGSGTPKELAAAAASASPISRVSSGAVPFLIVHGDRDRMVPLVEAQSFHDAFSRSNAQSTMVTIAGAGHDDPAFDRPATIAMTAAYLLTSLSMPTPTDSQSD